jgi:hypothetical protein
MGSAPAHEALEFGLDLAAEQDAETFVALRAPRGQLRIHRSDRAADGQLPVVIRTRNRRYPRWNRVGAR